MSTEWVVTTAAERVTLNEQRQGELTFTVTNPTNRTDRAVFDVVPGEGVDPAWFQVDEPQRAVRGTASVSYLVRAAIPAQTPPGDFAVQGRVYSADSAPEESSVLSSRVLFAIKGAEKPAKKRWPWWIWVVAALVAIVLAVTITLVVANSDEGPVVAPDGTVAVPDVSTLSIADARAALEDAGLVAQVKYRQDPAHAGTVQQPIPAGTRILNGSTVDVVFLVALKPPDLVSPANNSSAPRAKLPALTWKDPDQYVTSWRITVYQETCYYLALITPAQICRDLLTTDQIVTTTSYTPVLRFTLRPGTQVGVFHSGTFKWQVQAVDDFGNPGPASPLSSVPTS